MKITIGSRAMSSPIWEEQVSVAPWGVLRDYKTIPSESFDSFSCGNDDMDRWFKMQAMKDCRCGLCSCHVCVMPDNSIAGFFALSPSSVQSESLSSGMSGGISRLPIPVYLIGRLGVRTDLQGRGLGARLVREALVFVRELSRVGGGRLAIIDAKSEELAAWYEHLGFTRLKGNPLRLAMKMRRFEQAINGVNRLR